MAIRLFPSWIQNLDIPIMKILHCYCDMSQHVALAESGCPLPYQVVESSSEVGRMWHRELSDVSVKSTKLKEAWARWGGCDADSWVMYLVGAHWKKAQARCGGCDSDSQVTYRSLVAIENRLKQGKRQSERHVTWDTQVKALNKLQVKGVVPR